MTGPIRYIRSPTPAVADVRTFLNSELAKIQGVLDVVSQYLGAVDMLVGAQEGEALVNVVGRTTAGAATYTVQKIKYSKIGKLVVFVGVVTWTGHTGTGLLDIGPLPFSIDPALTNYPCMLDGISGVNAAATGLIQPVGANTMIQVVVSGTWGNQGMVAAGDCRFMGAYLAAS